MAEQYRTRYSGDGSWDRQGGSGGQPRRRSYREKRPITRPVWITVLIRIIQVLGTLVLVGAVTGIFMVIYAAVYVRTSIMPRAEIDFSVYTMDENSVMYYIDPDTGAEVEWLTLHGSERREYVKYEQIPENLINAFVAIEDKRFWDHHGVDWYRTAGAFLNMFLSMRDNFGASTITQQTIKNVTHYDDVTVTRKILEIFTALETEKKYKKEDILELYMNVIPLGCGCYGVQAASQYYFGKDVSELDLAECASLAGITNGPSLYSPYGIVHTTRYKCLDCGTYNNDPEAECDGCGAIHYGPAETWDNRRWNKARQQTILREMLNKDDGETGEGEPSLLNKIRTWIFGEEKEYHYITQEEYDQAVAETLVFTRDDPNAGDPDDGDPDDGDPDDSADVSYLYNWYQEQAISEAIDLVVQSGLDRKVASHMVYSGGLKIYTAYNPKVQAVVDQVYDDPYEVDYTSPSTGQKLQSNITIVDNSTGYVVAMGTTFPKTTNRGWNYPVDTVKQPGSSIKPLSVYGPGFEMGLINPGSPIDDSQTMTVNGRAWPHNADDRYLGLTSVYAAVVRSSNAVAAHTLERVTPQESYKFMTERFKFTSLVEDDISWSPLATGGLSHGVSTFEMAAAYAAYARNGSFVSARTVTRIDKNDGSTLVDNDPHGGETILKESTVYYMDHCMRAVVNGGAPGATGTSARVPGQTVSGKTGTTNDDTDLWFCGYTHYYTAAVWTGFDSRETIPNTITYRRYPAQVLFRKVMAQLCDGLPDQPLPEPEGLRSYSLCADCGLLAGSNCQADPRGNRVNTVKLLPEDAPTERCQCHVSMEVCIGGTVHTGEEAAEGAETGDAAETGYYTPTPYCPAETRRTVCLVDFERELAPGAVKPEDQQYLLSNFKMTTCPVHDENWSPEPSETPSDEPTDEPSEPPTGEPTEPPETDPPAPPTVPPPTVPPATEPPETDPPAPPTDPPATEPPPPPTEPPATDPPPVDSGPEGGG